MTANLDYEIVGDDKGPGVLELKMRDRSQLPVWEHGIPDDIQLQVAHQLAVTNREWARVTVGFGNQTVRIFEQARDKLKAKSLVEVQKADKPAEAQNPATPAAQQAQPEAAK